MNLKDFIIKFRKIIVYKFLTFLMFNITFFLIIFFINLKITSKRSKEIATQNIKYSYYLLKKNYKKLLEHISFFAVLDSKKELKFVMQQNDNIHALVILDKKGNIKKFYKFKKGLYNLKSLEEYLPILKNYKKKINKSNFLVTPLYPNFLGYQNSFLIGFPYYKENKQEGYLFAIVDTSFTGLLKDIYLLLFSKSDKISFIKYKISYDYFDKPGIKGINISYKIDEDILLNHVFHKTLNILFGIILVYIMIILMDFYFAYNNVYKDYKNLLFFLNKGSFQCNNLNLYFTKEICKKVSQIYSNLTSKNEKINLFLSVFDLIKENKDIKTILKDISSLLKLFVSCQDIIIYIFDTERKITMFSGNNKITIKEDTLDKIRKKFKDTNIVQEDENIYVRYFLKPFEIFYIFTNCKDSNSVYNLKDFIDIINLAIITALKFYLNSIQDPLTKAFNRQKLEYDLLEYLKLYKRHKDTFSIIMIDIDHLKNINEIYGYDAGDAVLKSLVKTIKGLLRKGDIIYRYSGEEFIILLPKTSLKEAVKVAEKLREKLMYIRVPYQNKIITFPISFGVTQVKDSDSLDTLLKRAYKALCKAKTKGGNRVEYEF